VGSGFDIKRYFDMVNHYTLISILAERLMMLQLSLDSLFPKSGNDVEWLEHATEECAPCGCISPYYPAPT
jgi:hypothetical protein